MKKIILLLVILGVAAALLGCIIGSSKRFFAQGARFDGSGNIVTESRPVPHDIHTIESSRGVQVVIAETAGDELRIEADDNLIDQVVTKVEKEKIEITIDPEIKRLNSFHATVILPGNGPFRALHASGGSTIRNEGTLETDRLEIRASSGSSLDIEARIQGPCDMEASGGSYVDAEIAAAACSVKASGGSRIEAEVTADEATIALSSGSHIGLEGSAAKCSGEASSGASLSAGKFEVADFRMKASSGSSARIHCTGRLQARASSGASIRYSGDCTTDITHSSGGNVARK